MSLKQALKSKNILIILYRIFSALWSRLFTNSLPFSIAIKLQKPLYDFDIAVSYFHNGNHKYLYGGCNDFVLKKVSAKKKVAWIHGDYELCGAKNKRNNKMYSRFDQIVTVSESCLKGFNKALPEMRGKATFIYNFHNIEEILTQSNAYIPSYEIGNSFVLVTVARLGGEKGHMRALDAIKRLADEGFRFEWYIIGDGKFKNKILERIDEYNLKNHVIVLGKQMNPYSYIRNADLFFLPSYHEAAPMTIGESKICMTPILTSEYISAREQIEVGKEGFIAENSEEGIYNSLRELLLDKSKIEFCKNYLETQKYSNGLARQQHNILFTKMD